MGFWIHKISLMVVVALATLNIFTMMPTNSADREVQTEIFPVVGSD